MEFLQKCSKAAINDFGAFIANCFPVKRDKKPEGWCFAHDGRINGMGKLMAFLEGFNDAKMAEERDRGKHNPSLEQALKTAQRYWVNRNCVAGFWSPFAFGGKQEEGLAPMEKSGGGDVIKARSMLEKCDYVAGKGGF